MNGTTQSLFSHELLLEEIFKGASSDIVDLLFGKIKNLLFNHLKECTGM